MQRNIESIGFVSIIGALLLVAAFSATAAAQRDDGTPAHDFAGTWSLRQSNGFTVTLKLSQTSTGVISGTATANAKNGVSTGTVRGRAWRTNGANGWQSNFDQFQIEIQWNGPVGVYNASASWAEGILKGQTYQKDRPSARANWTAGPFARRRGN